MEFFTDDSDLKFGGVLLLGGKGIILSFGGNGGPRISFGGIGGGGGVVVLSSSGDGTSSSSLG